jgi:cytochrome c-type biogenesis protein CcmH/NrfG
MMKRFVWIAVVIAVGALTLVGCSKSGVDTGKLESSFSSAPPADKSNVDAAVSSIKAGNYADALGKLQSVAAQAKLTDAQKQAVQDVIAQVQKQITAQAEKAAGDLKKTFGK